MNKDTALQISSEGIVELLYLHLKDSELKLKERGSFLALLTDLKQLFAVQDYIRENLK